MLLPKQKSGDMLCPLPPIGEALNLSAGVVKSVNTADLKSADLLVLAVQVRPPAPSLIKGLPSSEGEPFVS